MSKRIGAATVVLSVDVAQGSAAGGPSPQAVQSTAHSLLRFCVDHELPAVWTFANPASSDLADLIAADQPEAEIALLGDPQWASAGRGAMAAALSDRTLAAREAGQAISTLAILDSSVPVELDLLVKHGITAVRTPVAHAKAARRHGLRGLTDWLQPALDPSAASRPRVMRWGLWETPLGIDLIAAGARRSTAAIETAIRQRGLLHAAIDVAQVIDAGKAALKRLDVAVGHALRRREQGMLEFQTTCEVVARLMRPRQAMPAQSILHRRAA